MENYIPQAGDIIRWCDEEFIVIENNGNRGVVHPVGEIYQIGTFYWTYEGEKSEFVRKATEEELKAIES